MNNKQGRAKNLKSLTQVSEKLNISKPSLNSRMKKINNFKARFCTRKNNQLFLSAKGISLISYEKHNSTSRSFHTKKGNNTGQLTKTDLINTVHQLLSLNNMQKQKIHNLEIKPDGKLNSSVHKKLLGYTNLRSYLKKYNSKGRLYRFFHKIKK